MTFLMTNKSNLTGLNVIMMDGDPHLVCSERQRAVHVVGRPPFDNGLTPIVFSTTVSPFAGGNGLIAN